jgi:two-component system, NarL family, nitrate/nitrite sensor histidine kinase NarX
VVLASGNEVISAVVGPDSSTGQPPLRLGRRLSVALAAFVLLMLIAGGVSLFLGLRIHDINKRIDRNFSHALAAGEIYDTFHQIISEVQHIQATGMFDRFDRLPKYRRALAEKIRSFVAFHGIESASTLETIEGPFVERLGRIEAELRTLLDDVEKNFGSRVYLQPEKLVRLREVLDLGVANSEDLHRVHQARVVDLAQQSQRLIRLIVWLYLLFLMVGVLSVGAASLVLHRQVAAPLVRVAKAAAGIAEGRPEGRVPVVSRDEIGQLSTAFNLMADRLQARECDLRAAQAQLERKIRQLEILNQIGSEMLAFNGADGPATILSSIVGKARDLLGVEVAAICLSASGSGELRVCSTSGPTEAFVDGNGEALHAAACAPGTQQSFTDCSVMRPERVRSRLALPLKHGSEVSGLLCVGSFEERTFSADERDLATALAAQAAITLEHSRLDAEVRRLVILDERTRIARDIHDGLAQSVSLLHLKVRQAQAMIPPDQMASIGNALEEMAGISAAAYDEVRQSIYGLRTMVSASLGFVPTLTELLHEFSAQNHIQVKLEAEGAETVRLSPASEPQVIRIVQEAMSNVRKHAQVDRARVCVECKESWLIVSVQDDGLGFDPAKLATPDGLHFGLLGMRERAEGLGGKLEIVTAPGKGTRLTVLLPLEKLS